MKYNLAELRKCFEVSFNLEALSVDWNQVGYRETAGWDSVGHMQLIAEIEDTFDVMLETDDVIGLSSFSIAVEILERYGVSFEG